MMHETNLADVLARKLTLIHSFETPSGKPAKLFIEPVRDDTNIIVLEYPRKGGEIPIRGWITNWRDNPLAWCLQDILQISAPMFAVLKERFLS